MDKELFEREYKIHRDIADGVYEAETTKVTGSCEHGDALDVDVQSTYQITNPVSGIDYRYKMYQTLRVSVDGNTCRTWCSIEKR